MSVPISGSLLSPGSFESGSPLFVVPWGFSPLFFFLHVLVCDKWLLLLLFRLAFVSWCCCVCFRRPRLRDFSLLSFLILSLSFLVSPSSLLSAGASSASFLSFSLSCVWWRLRCSSSSPSFAWCCYVECSFSRVGAWGVFLVLLRSA